MITQGYQKVIACGAGHPDGYAHVCTYTGSQTGWLNEVVPVREVNLVKAVQLRKLYGMIANHTIVCTNPELRGGVNVHYLSKVLIHRGNLQ